MNRHALKFTAGSAWLTAGAIAGTYALFGMLWILFSDRLLALWVNTPEELTRLQTVKGWFYVLVTAALVAVMVALSQRRQRRMIERLIRQRNKLNLLADCSSLSFWEIEVKHATEPQWESLSERLHEDDRAQVQQCWQDHLAGRTPSVELEHRLRDGAGEFRWVICRGRVIERDGQGRPVRIGGTSLDITDRRNAEDQIQRLAAAVEHAMDTMIITDTQGLIQYVNPAFEKITGYSMAEVIGRDLVFLRSGQHSDEFYTNLWTTIRSGEPWSGRVLTKARNGKVIEESVNISPIFDAQRRIIGFVGIQRDVSVQRELEDRLRQAQKMEAIGQLAGGVAHDFNNLLQVILGRATMVMEQLPPDSESRSDLDQLLDAGDRASRLVRQLLTFSRRQRWQPRRLEINPLIGELMKMLHRVIGDHIELQFDPGPDLPCILADPGQIDQVLMNLCLNARDAIVEQGRIHLRTEAVHCDAAFCAPFPWARPGYFVRLSIADTGEGIPQENLPRIYDPFFTTKDVGKGTGLGLATVYGIIEQLGAMIAVESRIGEGTTFRIFLPVAADDAAIETPLEPVHVQAIPGAGQWILLAEDNEAVRALTLNLLVRAGYRVLEAFDGEQAVQLFEQDPQGIDLVLLDVVMPRMGGRQVYRRIKPQRPDLPVIFCSGYADDSHQDGGGPLPQDWPVLHKPYRSHELLSLVAEVLGHRPTPR